MKILYIFNSILFCNVTINFLRHYLLDIIIMNKHYGWYQNIKQIIKQTAIKRPTHKN